MQNSSIIILNIGGTIFHSTLSTLSSKENFFKVLCSSSDDNAREFFVDRDGTHFMYILNYLRGSSVLPYEKIVLEKLLQEADFYCLLDLKKNIQQRLQLTFQ